MTAIKEAYQSGRMTATQAAKKLTAHNGNPLAGNMQIVRRWHNG